MIVPLPWSRPPQSQVPQREVVFTIPGEPATKSRPRVTTRGGKVRTYSPDHVKRAEAGMGAAFLEQVKRLAPSNTHSFGVRATFYVGSGQRRDVDNMLKLVLDGLNKIAWADDHQVYEVTGRKVQVEPSEARTEVTVYPIAVLPSRIATCEHCGEEFPRPPSHAAKKYCSADCRSAALAARRRRTCAHCGSKFQTRQTRSGEQEYCSPECSYAAKHIEAECVRCGTKFTKARSLNRSGNSYCSEECKATYWRENRKSAAKGTCHDCGGPTTKKTYKRCRDCSYAAGGRHADKDHPPSDEGPALWLELTDPDGAP